MSVLESVGMRVCGFSNVLMCVFVCFVICGCVYVWVFSCVGVCMCAFCNVGLYVCIGFVMCGCVYVWVS